MDRNELKSRTKQFALRIVRLSSALPKNREGEVLGRQVLKSGTSIGANYREAIRASSRKQFISTLEISIREAEETIYWLELLGESEIIHPDRLQGLMEECNQLLAILTSTVRTAKQKKRDENSSAQRSRVDSARSNQNSEIRNPK